jgi:pimeloyl-ACP methyl ester carboxylesterase
LPVGRYLGELNPDATLRNARTLKENGYLSATARLEIMAYDVDSDGAVTGGVPPEIDQVFFNDRKVGTLTGAHQQWTTNTFHVPIEWVRFPNKGTLTAPLVSALNEIRIEIDTANADAGMALWCTSVSWANMRFNAMSPVVLIHGNTSDGGFFQRNKFTEYLDTLNLPYDRSINLVPNDATVSATAELLADSLPGVIKNLGADSVHVVAHSKGGLATRDYLARFYSLHKSLHNFSILSLTTLSTPHNGSVLADVAVLREQLLFEGANVEFENFPAFTGLIAALIPVNAGTRTLTLARNDAFNDTNTPLLPSDIIYNVVAADADDNGNRKIDGNMFSPAHSEYRELTNESPELNFLDVLAPSVGAGLVDPLYQILRHTARVEYRTETRVVRMREDPFETFEVPVAIVESVPRSEPVGNDTLVPIPSGVGKGTFENLVENCLVLVGSIGFRNPS